MYGTKTNDPETAIKYESFSWHAMRCCLAVVVSSWLLCISQFLSSGDWLLASWPHFMWNANTVLPEKSAKLKHWALKGTADRKQTLIYSSTHARTHASAHTGQTLGIWTVIRIQIQSRQTGRERGSREFDKFLLCSAAFVVQLNLVCTFVSLTGPSQTFPSVSVKLVCFRS